MYFDHSANASQYNPHHTSYQQGDPYSGQYPTPPPLHSTETADQYSIPISASAAYHTTTQQVIEGTPSSAPYSHHTTASHPQHIDTSDQLQYYFGTYGDAFEQEQEPLSSTEKPKEQNHQQQKPGFLSQWRSARNKKEQTSGTIVGTGSSTTVGPTLAPEDEKESYKVQPFEEHARRRRPLTCSTCLCFLIFLILCGGGIALMIASKVFRDQCSSQCSSDTSDSSLCQDPRCNSTLQSAILYGGAVLTGLGGLGILWQLIRWRCCMRR